MMTISRYIQMRSNIVMMLIIIVMEKIDEEGSINALVWFADSDSDGFGDVGSTLVACEQPTDYVDNSDDCDDVAGNIHPDATEVCGDNLDNNCDGAIDDGSASDALEWFLDHDQDGFGDPAISQMSCEQPNLYVLDNTDCNDLSALANLSADEFAMG